MKRCTEYLANGEQCPNEAEGNSKSRKEHRCRVHAEQLERELSRPVAFGRVMRAVFAPDFRRSGIRHA